MAVAIATDVSDRLSIMAHIPAIAEKMSVPVDGCADCSVFRSSSRYGTGMPL